MTDTTVDKWQEICDIVGDDNQLKATRVATLLSRSLQQAREEILSELDMVWVCPPCAKRFFNRGYTEGKTNISTAVHRQCEACHEYNQCMHHRSYDLLTKEET